MDAKDNDENYYSTTATESKPSPLGIDSTDVRARGFGGVSRWKNRFADKQRCMTMKASVGSFLMRE